MSLLLTNLHYQAFNHLEFDIPYYHSLCKGKKAIELCAGFGRVCNRLYKMGVDISAIEMNKHNYNLIDLPNTKSICNNIFNCFDLKKTFDVVIAPFNSFPIFFNEFEYHLLFKLIAKLLKPEGLASLSYYHPDGWRIVQPDENFINIGNTEYTYTSNFDLSKRTNKQAIWEDIFINTLNRSEKRVKYNLKVYENISDLNNICKAHDLECIKRFDNFYNVSDYEPGWVEYQLIKIT